MLADHVFINRRCIHCDSDNHSLPEAGEELAPWQQPCPVPFDSRQTKWTFGSPPPIAQLRATWAGECPGCGAAFSPGDPVRAFGQGEWGHAGCEQPDQAGLGPDDIADSGSRCMS